MFIDDKLFCCLLEEQQEEIRNHFQSKNFKMVYNYQNNLEKTKTGYRCKNCGSFYPYLKIKYKEKLIIPEDLVKPEGVLTKYKKAVSVFCGTHFYTQNKNSLLKFVFDKQQNSNCTESFSIMSNVCHIVISHDEKYIATENFQGTIALVDLNKNVIIAKRQKCNSNGSFVFTEDNRLLYFSNGAIINWDFVKNEEESIWLVPHEWKQSRCHNQTINVVCNNVIYNDINKTYLFQFATEFSTKIVAIKNNSLEKIFQLPKSPTLCKLVYIKELNKYTFVSNDSVYIYDSNFCVIEEFDTPKVEKISDGDGFFPITKFIDSCPTKVVLSPNEEWIILDYFTSLILMKHNNYVIKHCIFSYTGKAAKHIGFVDNKHFWYTWGDATYIQEI